MLKKIYIHLNLDYRISDRGHSPGLYPTPYFHFRIPVTRLQTCTPWVYGKYLTARPTYNVAKSIHVNLDYRISGRGHSPGLYPTPYYHFRFPVTRRKTCTAWVYGKYLIARPPFIVAKSVHLNLDYRVSGRGHSPGEYPTPNFHFRIPVTRRQTCTAWVDGKYLIALLHIMSLRVSMSICIIESPAEGIRLDYIRRHISTPYFHFRFPVARRQTCIAWVYGKYVIARPIYNVAKSIHVNLGYRISGRRHSPGLYPTPYFHFHLW